MKYYLKRYGLITCSLLVLFGSGIAAGYRLAMHHGAAAAGSSGPAGGLREAGGVSPDQWIENTALALQKDLGLDEAQALKVRSAIATPAMGIFAEKQQANFKIHLRLLQVHDTLAQEAGLTEEQQSLLKTRREQLRRHILEKFKDLIGDKPDPLLSNL